MNVRCLLPLIVTLMLAVFPCACTTDDDGDSSTSSEPVQDDDAAASDDDNDGGGQGKERITGYIRGDVYRKLVFEVDLLSDHEPRQEAIEELEGGLTDFLDKPDGVEVVIDEELDERSAVWTFNDLKEVADETFDLAVTEDSIKIHLLYMDGEYDSGEDNSGTVLGLAWNNTHLTIFVETIQNMCSSYAILPSLKEKMCAKAELFVLSHEIGHIIGLVNLGLSMVENHEDAAHQHHDLNDKCLMYWAYEGESILDLIRDRLLAGDNSNLGLCDTCLADIAAVRDK